MATDWKQGDYRVVADRLRPAARHLVELAAPAAGERVADVAAGSGNLARFCTARGASVVAVDLVAEQLRLGPDAEDDPDIAWVVGDAHALPLRDGVVDAALSTFGLMYAGRPEAAVAEVARICRPGGMIGLTTWQTGGFQEGAGRVLSEMTGEVPQHDHLAVWGSAEQVATRLAAVADDVRVSTGELVVRAESIDAWWASREQAPPIASARASLSAEGYAELAHRMREVARACGTESDDGFSVIDVYLIGLGRVR